MKKSRKIMLIGLLAAVVLTGSLVGVAYAQGTGTTDQSKTLFARVAAILGIDQTTLESAFKQAQKEMANEALDARLKALVEQGKITQEQAEQYKKWWQARPDTPLPDIRPFRRFDGHHFPGGRRWGGSEPQSTPGTST